ncbi:MAG TPA: hypothetical protein VHD33_06215 [Legionellaceae bacterium]|nr:hypothetical protein [Legionellaceae bacterium]
MKAYTTLGQIHADFAAGKLTPKEAAEATMALQKPKSFLKDFTYILLVSFYIGLLITVLWK